MTQLPHQGLHSYRCLLLSMQRVGGLMTQVPHQSKGLHLDALCRLMSEGQRCMACWCGNANTPFCRRLACTCQHHFASCPASCPATRPPSSAQAATLALDLEAGRSRSAAPRLSPAGATSSMPSVCHVQHCNWHAAALVQSCGHSEYGECILPGCHRLAGAWQACWLPRSGLRPARGC